MPPGVEDITLHLMHLVNTFRAENGRPPLERDELLRLYAKWHSEHMAHIGKLEHAPEHLLGAHAETIGVAEGHEHPFQLAEIIFDRWTHSKTGHREILLNAHSGGMDVAFRNGPTNRLHMTGKFRFRR